MTSESNDGTRLIGQEAPGFTLKAAGSAEPVSLSDYRDKSQVVLLFYPFAFSSVCTTELCGIRDSLGSYEALDAQVLAITADSPFVLEEWAKQEGFGYPLLSDFNREIAPLYDSLYETLGDFKGVPKRSAFVIDKSGVVRHAEICATPGDLPDFEAIRSALSA